MLRERGVKISRIIHVEGAIRIMETGGVEVMNFVQYLMYMRIWRKV